MAVARYKWLAVLMALTAVAIAVRAAIYETSPIFAGVLGAAIMLLCVAIAWKEWQRHDEASREAHKASWFWGASVGIALTGIALSMMMATRDSFAQLPAIGQSDPLGYFALGALATMVAQLICYVVAFAYWWLSKR